MSAPAKITHAVRSAPVTSITTVESLTGAVLTFLVMHHVIGDIDVSGVTQTVTPFVALALPAVFGAAKWWLVKPVARVEQWAESTGIASDADFARLEAVIDAKLDGLLPASAFDDDTFAHDDDPILEPAARSFYPSEDVPAGLGAGAPG